MPRARIKPRTKGAEQLKLEAKRRARNQNALEQLGLEGAEKIRGEINESHNGNCVYETGRKIVVAFLSRVIFSHEVFPYPGYIANVPEASVIKNTIAAIMLDDYEVKMIHDVFKTIDVDGSGALSIKEFFNHFQLTYVTTLAEKYFKAFDEDASGELDFAEFIVAAWNFCGNCDKVGVINMAFDVYDEDKSGTIDAKEALMLLTESYGDTKHMNQHTMTLVHQLGNMGEMEIQMPKSAFVAYVMKNESVFFPIFTLQMEMRRSICGNEFWERIRKSLVKKVGTNFKAPNFSLSHCKRAIKLCQADLQMRRAERIMAGDIESDKEEDSDDDASSPLAHNRVKNFDDAPRTGGSISKGGDNSSPKSIMSSVSSASRRHKGKKSGQHQGMVKKRGKNSGKRTRNARGNATRVSKNAWQASP